jgi:hypothetical protein
MPDDDLERSEIEALAAARAELGPEYDAALLSSFADRVERAIDLRVGQVLQEQARGGHLELARDNHQLTLGLLSAVAAIPISIVLGLKGNELALLITMVGIVLVNFAHAVHAGRTRQVRRGR